MADLYAEVQKGGLKLKGVSDVSIKKKKKKKKEQDMKKRLEQITSTGDSTEDELFIPPKRVETRTNAELAFQKRKEKRDAERILEKASKTHKERILDFNAHLDNLSEHYDIPKVSWTK